ncbi:hypothetical protein SADUNF_Sadunf13G0115900 [Salix dunnii]|uniref:Uncharacterized protein n=1 Tax=Salix dunnii TaxID=1413687 RepID=A0A835JIH1_9ROSI|nr:hypothetical protein SADUNF_Sadunf13G0115900 [Salix dunnii]
MVVQLINEMADKGFSADANLVRKRLLGFCEGHQGEKANQEKLNRGGQKLLESCCGVWRSPLQVLKLKRGGPNHNPLPHCVAPALTCERMGKMRKVGKMKGEDNDNGRGPTLTATKLPLLFSPVKDDYLDALATAAAEVEQGASIELTTAQ